MANRAILRVTRLGAGVFVFYPLAVKRENNKDRAEKIEEKAGKTKLEAEKTKLLIATESQRVAEKEAETDRLKAQIVAQKDADVAKIEMEKELMKREAKQKISSIEDSINLNRQKSEADAKYYTQVKEADSNQALLTQPFLEYMHILALSNNTKVYFGDKMPSLFIEKQSGK